MRTLRPGGVPFHPALVHFPIACWTGALLMELAALGGAGAGWWEAARLALAAGTVTGLLAAAAGFLEYAATARDPGVARLVERHLVLAGLAWTCFTANWLWRVALPGAALPDAPWPAFGLLGLSLSGFGLLLAAGHAGARLVYVHGVGSGGAAHE